MLKRLYSHKVLYDLVISGKGLQSFLQNIVQTLFTTPGSTGLTHNHHVNGFINEINEAFAFGDVAIAAMAKAYEKSNFKNVASSKMAHIFTNVQLSLGTGKGVQHYSNSLNEILELIAKLDVIKTIDNNGIDTSDPEFTSNRMVFDILSAIFENYIISFEAKNNRKYITMNSNQLFGIVVDHLRSIYAEKYYHISRGLEQVLDKSEYSILPIELKNAVLIFKEKFRISEQSQLVSVSDYDLSDTFKGEKNDLFYFEAIKLLNGYIQRVFTVSSLAEAKTFVRELIENIRSLPASSDLDTNLLSHASIYEEIRALPFELFGTEFTNTFFENFAKKLESNLDKLLSETTNGFELTWRETLNAHLGSGVKFDDIIASLGEQDFFVIDENFPFTLVGNNYFETHNTPFLWIHRINKQTGEIINGIMSVKLTNNKLPSDDNYDYFEGFYNSRTGRPITGVYACDKNGEFLLSRIGYDEINRNFFVQDIDWYEDSFTISYETMKINGKDTEVARITYWRSSTKVVGDGITAFLQKVESYVIPHDPYEGPIKVDIKSSKASSLKTNAKNQKVLPKKSENINERTERNTVFVSNLVSQLSRPYRAENPDIFVLDNSFRITKEGQTVVDGITKERSFSQYSRKHILDVLKTMNPTKNMLSSMTYYRLLNDKVLKNINTEKGFFEAWLERITYALSNPQVGTPNCFYKFKHLAKLSFTSGTDLQIINDATHPEFGKNDYKLIESIKEALIEVFSYEGFTLLDHGIMSFTTDSSGNYDIVFKNHPRHELELMLNQYNIGTIIDTKGSNLFNDLRVGSYTRISAFWASDLIMGHRQFFDVSTIDENGIETTSPMEMVTLPSNSLMNSLYTEYSLNRLRELNTLYNKEILLGFFKDYYSDLVPSLKTGVSNYIGNIDSILEGRQILLEMFYRMFVNKISTVDLTNYVPNQLLDKFYSKEVTLDYMVLEFLEYIYKPQSKTGVIERDYIKLIKEALTNNGGVIEMGSSVTGSAMTKNKLFDATDPASGKSGLQITIDLSLFTPEQLQKVLWTLHFDGVFEIDFKKNILLTQNIINEIKSPFIHLYTTIYNTLKSYSQDFYTSTTRTDFSVSFYKPSLSGMSKMSALSNQLSGELGSNKIDKIDFTNEEEFRRQIAAITFYMVKYLATINVKQGFSGSQTSVLFANLLKVLDEEYMKQNFYGDNIGGTLLNSANDNAWLESDYFEDLPYEFAQGFSLSALYPIWLFTNADSFHNVVTDMFNDMRANFGGASSIFPTFRNPDDILMLKAK